MPESFLRADLEGGDNYWYAIQCDVDEN